MQKPKQIPTKCGVYIFKNKQQEALYIGKAGNLKKRLVSYWLKNASSKTQRLVHEATSLAWQETASEIEALILEARLIKQHLPKYNVLMRDDKNYFFVRITREEFPKIFTTHQPQNKRAEIRDRRSVIGKQKLTPNRYPLISRHIGPFTGGSALKTTLRFLRRIFPYCTCKTPHKRLCLNAQIDRCSGFCCDKRQATSDQRRKEYKNNIRNIIAVLQGKKQKLLAELKKQIRKASQKQEYERAARLRDQIAGLEDVFAHRNVLELPRAKSNWSGIEQKLRLLLSATSPIKRMEGYDISNISGTDATGSMVVFTNGKPDKKEYRIFRIKTVAGANDPAMIGEIIKRRIQHPEWKLPNLIIIDGGKIQLATAKSEILNLKSEIILTALAKQEEELYTEKHKTPIPLKTLDRDILHLFQAVRDEAHRFAKKYHHTVRKKLYESTK